MELEISQTNIRVWLQSAHVLCVLVLPGPPFLVEEAGLVPSNGRSGFRPMRVARTIFFKQKKTGVISVLKQTYIHIMKQEKHPGHRVIREGKQTDFRQ